MSLHFGIFAQYLDVFWFIVSNFALKTNYKKQKLKTKKPIITWHF